ncbi:hypothetical protein [Parabacteroides sp. Marseille-P3160]|nr:hypothetical protein [Parabacteroides sp. Marseille-P3160]
MRTALITGTSSGLGKSLTDFFADNNWYVIATSRNPKGSWKNNKNVLEI